MRFINHFIKRGSQEISEDELGFGHAFDRNHKRLIKEDGSFNIERKGKSVNSVYLELVSMSWFSFSAVLVTTYFLINAIFGLIFYVIGVEQIKGITPTNHATDFINAFFFSIQSFTTVGYGHLSPSTMLTSFVASLASFVGLLSFALATGLFFARFSKPRPAIRFSSYMLISPLDDMNSLQIRTVHMRDSKIIGLEARVILSWLEKDDEGLTRRRFHRLSLDIDSIFLYPLNWTIVHKINEDSPLYQCTMEKLKAMNAEVLILVKGYDESYGKTVHASKSYDCSQLIVNARFIPMYETKEDRTILHLDRIDDIIEMGSEKLADKRKASFTS